MFLRLNGCFVLNQFHCEVLFAEDRCADIIQFFLFVLLYFSFLNFSLLVMQDDVDKIEKALKGSKVMENVAVDPELTTEDRYGRKMMDLWWEEGTDHRSIMLDPFATHAGFGCSLGPYGEKTDAPYCTMYMIQYGSVRIKGEGGKSVTIPPVVI